MTLEAAVEALARAMPGASWCVDEDGDPEPQFDMESGDLLFWPMSSWPNHKLREGGRALVQVWGPPPLAEHILDAREAILVLRCALLGTHADRPWAEVLLGAMPRECPDCEGLGGGFEEVEDSPFEDDMGAEWDCLECGGGENRRGSGKAPGDPEARTLLTAVIDIAQSLAKLPPDVDVWLDARLARGDCEDRLDGEKVAALVESTRDAVKFARAGMAELLALYLGQQPCEVCEGKGERPLLTHESSLDEWADSVLAWRDGDQRRCACAGSGLALGAHDRAMAEAGERLAVGLEQAEAAE